MSSKRVECHAFADGAMLASEHGSLALRCHSAGLLTCPTGGIVVCDAGSPLDGIPFDRSVGPGRYEVVATVVRSEAEPAPRIGYITLRIHEVLPAAWIEARPRGFAGDNSIACMMDVVTASAWSACYETEGEQEAWARLLKEVSKDAGRPFADFTVDAAKGLNMIAWMEEGDCGGRFLYGLDPGGRVVCITVDTEFLKWAGTSGS